MKRLSRITLLAACSGLLPVAVSAQTAAAPASAAVVPGADIFFNVDLAAARKSPLFQELEKKGENPEMEKKMKDATGLVGEDLVRFSGSVDIDSINFAGEPTPEQIANLPAVLSIQLAKSITRDQLKKGLNLSLTEQPGVEIDITDGADGLLKLRRKAAEGEKQPEPFYSGLSADGKQVFLAAGEKSIQSAVARAASGKLEPLPAGLAAMASGNTHMQVAVLLPQAAKDGIAKAIDGATQGNADPGAVMMAGMLAPLKGLSKVALKANFNPADLALSFAADLGQAEAATQATMMLNTMVMPMLAQGLGQDPSKPSRITVGAQGSVVSLRGSMTKDELLNLGASAGGPDGLPGEDAP